MVNERATVYDLQFELLFATSYRAEIFTNDVRKAELAELLYGFAKANGSTITDLKIQASYVKMVISFPPKYAPSSLVKSFKGAAAREWFKSHPEDKEKVYKGHLWHKGFFIHSLESDAYSESQEYIVNIKKEAPCQK